MLKHLLNVVSLWFQAGFKFNEIRNDDVRLPITCSTVVLVLGALKTRDWKTRE